MMLPSFFSNLAEKVGWKMAPVISSSYASVIGQMHLADDIPNQDSACRTMRPDVTAFHTMRRRRNPRRLPGVFLIGVFDGHGPQGEQASALASERMNFAIDRKLMDDQSADLETVVREAFEEVTAALNSAQCGMDSGTTASIAIVKDEQLVIANVGDSKVLLLSDDGIGKVCSRYASPVHRPVNEDEAARITAAGGHVLEGYVVDKEQKNGLAVSRTIGDRDMHQFGCISEPHIELFAIGKEDSAIVLASDGLWDHTGLNEKDVWKAAAKRPGRKRTAKKVCEEMLRTARKYGDPGDDCTVACLTLK